MDSFEQERTRERLGHLDALASAQERRDEVMAVVEASEDPDEAARGLMRLLGLDSEAQAMTVLDMQWRRWTKQDRQRLALERHELRTALDAP